jgi:putative ABC transport system substrate-binding protein
VLVQSGSVLAEEQETGLEKAADALGLRLLVLPVSGERDFEPAFAKLVAEGADALVVTAGAFFTSQREKIVALAAQHRIPAVYARREHAAAGGLLSYASNVAHMYRRAGVYAGLILNGAKPADLPVELPTKFELVINLKAAKALGLALPDKLLALTDEVIE